jgi:hypothetical protein
MRFKLLHIWKISDDEDNYVYSIPDDGVVDERVNGAQLIAVIQGRDFVATTAEDVLRDAYSLYIEQKITRRFLAPL